MNQFYKYTDWTIRFQGQDENLLANRTRNLNAIFLVLLSVKISHNNLQKLNRIFSLQMVYIQSFESMETPHCYAQLHNDSLNSRIIIINFGTSQSRLVVSFLFIRIQMSAFGLLSPPPSPGNFEISFSIRENIFDLISWHQLVAKALFQPSDLSDFRFLTLGEALVDQQQKISKTEYL